MVFAYRLGQLAGLEGACRQRGTVYDVFVDCHLQASDGGAALPVVQHHEDFALNGGCACVQPGLRGGGDVQGEVGGGGACGEGCFGLPAFGRHDEEVVRGEAFATLGGEGDGLRRAIVYLLNVPFDVEGQLDARVAGYGEGGAVGQGEDDARGVVGVHVPEEAVAFLALDALFALRALCAGIALVSLFALFALRALGTCGAGISGIALVTLLAVLAADAVPRPAAVHAQVDGVGYDGFALGVLCYAQAGTCGELGYGGGGACSSGIALVTLFAFVALRALGTGVAGVSLVSLLALLAVGADGVAVGVGQEFAVQRPVPVAVLALRDAYLRGGACGSGGSGSSRVTRIAFVTLLPVVDGDGVGVEERNGVAHFGSVLHDGRHGRDVVRGAEQRLQGLDVGVGFRLPGLESGDAFGLCGDVFSVLVDLLP